MPSQLDVFDLGRYAYRPAWRLQERLVAQRQADEIPDTLLLVEHDPVYTLGRRGDDSHITATPEALERWGIEVVRSNRGGDVTYHGPGQLVGYPIMRLTGRDRGPVWYVTKLEQAIIDMLAEYGIEGGRDDINRGVWVGHNKIAAIGIRITRQVTMHGFALNVSTNLQHYAGIVPCGIRGRGVTSMQQLVDNVQLEAVKERLLLHLAEVFGYDSVVRKEPQGALE